MGKAYFYFLPIYAYFLVLSNVELVENLKYTSGYVKVYAITRLNKRITGIW